MGLFFTILFLGALFVVVLAIEWHRSGALPPSTPTGEQPPAPSTPTRPERPPRP